MLECLWFASVPSTGQLLSCRFLCRLASMPGKMISMHNAYLVKYRYLGCPSVSSCAIYLSCWLYEVWRVAIGKGKGELSGVNFESGYMQGIMWITLLISSCFQTGYGYLSHTPTGKLVFTILEPCNISDYDIILVEIFIYWLEPWSRSRGSELNQR